MPKIEAVKSCLAPTSTKGNRVWISQPKPIKQLPHSKAKQIFLLSAYSKVWGAIHQFLRIILKLRILVLLLVSTLPFVVKVKNYS
jgi:antibiotic biosynthesis monooxygenase (ABM) superfamily enzyme